MSWRSVAVRSVRANCSVIVVTFVCFYQFKIFFSNKYRIGTYSVNKPNILSYFWHSKKSILFLKVQNPLFLCKLSRRMFPDPDKEEEPTTKIFSTMDPSQSRLLNWIFNI
jgi:hypothetical protein